MVQKFQMSLNKLRCARYSSVFIFQHMKTERPCKLVSLCLKIVTEKWSSENKQIWHNTYFDVKKNHVRNDTATLSFRDMNSIILEVTSWSLAWLACSTQDLFWNMDQLVMTYLQTFWFPHNLFWANISSKQKKNVWKYI